MESTNKVRIFKYPLPTVPGKFTIKFDPPLVGRHWFKEQRGLPMLYAEVSDDCNGMKECDFIAVMTGQAFSNAGDVETLYDYMGTAMLHNGNFVLHYYVDWDSMYARWDELHPDECFETTKEKIECVTTPQ